MGRIYPSEIQLNKANASDTEAPFMDLLLSISNGFFSSEIYVKCDDFDFDIVKFPFFWMRTFHVLPLTVFTFLNLFDSLECLFMRLTSMHAIKVYTATLFQHGYRYHKLHKTFSKFTADTMN